MTTRIKSKNLSYYLGLPYRIILEKWDDGDGPYWVARIAELPHCMTTGASPQEAAADIQDAKEEWLKSSLERGINIPEPSPSSHSGQIRLRIPTSLHRALADRAYVEGVSLNQYMTAALGKTVGIIEEPGDGPRTKRIRKHPRRMLTVMANEATAEYRAGRTEELDPDKM